MIRKTISMPDNMGSWINERILEGQYNNESEYFRDLVRKDQERQTSIKELRHILLSSEESGVSKYTVIDLMNEVEVGMEKNGKLPSN